MRSYTHYLAYITSSMKILQTFGRLKENVERFVIKKKKMTIYVTSMRFNCNRIVTIVLYRYDNTIIIIRGAMVFDLYSERRNSTADVYCNSRRVSSHSLSSLSLTLAYTVGRFSMCKKK